MRTRLATAADGPAIDAQWQAAAGAGTFAGWGGAEVPGSLASYAERWVIEDDAGTVRGWLQVILVGTAADPETPGRWRPLWRYALAVLDPTLAPLAFARLYLGLVRDVAAAHPGAMMEGGVVAGSTLDRLWQRYLADVRAVREAPRTGGGMLREAYYRCPAEMVGSRLAGI